MFGKSYEETEQKLEAASAEISARILEKEGTFAELSNEWLQLKVPQLKASSIAKYTNLLDLYLLPAFEDKSVSEISRTDIIQWSSELLTSGGAKAKGLAPKTVNSILSLMTNILEYAAREKSIQTADTKDISIKQPQKPMRILSRVEQQRLSSYLKDNLTPCNMGILLCLYTGLRIGEICALTWKDILMDEQCLYIHQTMQRIQVKDNGGKKTAVIIMPPKSDCSIRRIPIPDKIRQLLSQIQKQDKAYLLTGMVHSYVEPRNTENRFKAVTKECNINDVNFHALRHTFASILIGNEVPLINVSNFLGHSDISTTANIYAHLDKAGKQVGADVITDIFKKK